MYSRIEDNNNEVIDFVYDCGSASAGFYTDNGFLDKILSNLPKHWECFKTNKINNKPTIDYLYISHFDNDHINGIKKLCEIFHFAKMIYPFHPESYRTLNVLHQIYNAEENIDPDILRVIYNPTEENLRLLIAEGEETQFICLGNEDSENSPPGEEFFMTPEETSKGDAKQNGYHIKPIKGAYNRWILYSFMPVLPNDTPNLDEIFQEFNKEFSDQDIISKLQNGLLKKTDFKKFYKEKFPKQSDKEYDTSLFNRSSLMLYSGLVKSAQLESSKIIFSREEDQIFYMYLLCRYKSFFINWGFSSKKQRYALLLTGDAELKMNTNWHEYLIGLKENITTVNLPHHGSEKNMDKETFKGFNKIQNFLTFSGDRTKPNSAKEKHPNVQAMQDAITAQPKANIIHVNQLQGLFEIIAVQY